MIVSLLDRRKAKKISKYAFSYLVRTNSLPNTKQLIRRMSEMTSIKKCKEIETQSLRELEKLCKSDKRA